MSVLVLLLLATGEHIVMLTLLRTHMCHSTERGNKNKSSTIYLRYLDSKQSDRDRIEINTFYINT